MNGFAFNTRNPLFADIRVREALGMLFDFEWVNRNLFFGMLQRSNSYFAGSDLSAAGIVAGPRERSLLAPYPSAVRPDILEGRWQPPSTDGSGRDRDLARRALALLHDAGWVIEGDALRRSDTHEPLSFELMVNSRGQERLALNYAQSLSRIGVEARVRLVDDVQYWRRLGQFDFGMIQWFWPSSASPGNEQRNRWSAAAASRPGSLNYTGADAPAIDAMIDAMLAAKTREEFAAAVRALDRVLLSGFYVVPLFYLPDQWLAYDSGLKHPEIAPLLGATVDVWWRHGP
jgi:peptide/nickel transport system substrate-binding protein